MKKTIIIAISIFTTNLIYSQTLNEYWALADSIAAKKNYAEAIRIYTKAISIDSTKSGLYSDRAFAKAQLEDYTGAIKDYSKAIKLYPNGAKLYFDRANIEFKLKNYKEAIKDYTKAIETPSDLLKSLKEDLDQVSYGNRGLAKIALGNVNEGCIDLSRAGELGFAEAYQYIKEYCNK